MVREYLCDQYTPQSKLGKSLISLILRSRSVLCVIPMQDYMGLDKSDLTEDLKQEIHGMTLRYGRMNWN